MDSKKENTSWIFYISPDNTNYDEMIKNSYYPEVEPFFYIIYSLSVHIDYLFSLEKDIPYEKDNKFVKEIIKRYGE